MVVLNINTMERVKINAFEVGDLFLTTNEINPENRFMGKWQLVAIGRTLIGVDPNDNDFNVVCKTGGSKTHIHSLLNAFAKLVLRGTGSIDYREKQVSNWTSNYTSGTTGNAKSYTSNSTWGTELGGNTDSSSNVMPYYTCYIWRRYE